MAHGIFASADGVVIRETAVPDVLPPRYVRVATEYSAASVGTELSMLRRARESKSAPIPIGYSAVGRVVEAGLGTALNVGQRAAVYGAPYVSHSGELVVPQTLAVPVPDTVDPLSASTVGLGAIALHALHSAEVEIGQHAVVIGLGILGIILARLAAAAGMFVYATDLKPERRERVNDPRIQVCEPHELQELVGQATGGHGADVVFLMVGSADTDLLTQAVEMTRLRGTVSIVSDADAKLPREALFSREVRLIVPQAGGPGRYRTEYEREARDYPYSEVRFTEGRNMADYIRLLERGFLTVSDLLPQPIPIEGAREAYDRLESGEGSDLTIVFTYGEEEKNA